MRRREVLKYTAILTGGALAAPLTASLFSGCTPEQAADESRAGLKFFTDEDFKLLTEIVDTILPATDSPSATDVGVHLTIDHMVGTVYSQEARDNYAKAFKGLKEHLNGDKPFVDLDPGVRLDILQPLDTGDEASEVNDAFRNLKQQTIAYYLSTEKISKEYLNFLPVPGEYKPCVTLEEVGGKAWAI